MHAGGSIGILAHTVYGSSQCLAANDETVSLILLDPVVPAYTPWYLEMAPCCV